MSRDVELRLDGAIARWNDDETYKLTVPASREMRAEFHRWYAEIFGRPVPASFSYWLDHADGGQYDGYFLDSIYDIRWTFSDWDEAD